MSDYEVKSSYAKSYAVLLKSGRGHMKEETNDGNQLKHVAVYKGSLLAYLDSLTITIVQEKYGRCVNYKVSDRCEGHQSEVFLLVDTSSIFHLTTLQKEFLLGIRQKHCRIEVLERLQWVESLKVGSEVCVTIATIPTPVRGVIRYIGSLLGEEGRQLGIELMVCITLVCMLNIKVYLQVLVYPFEITCLFQ